ncbi:hypothetical protein PGB90_004794 [Kerria lacca]
MGRVLRMRKRKKKNPKPDLYKNSTLEYVELVKWMKELGWKPTCKLVSSYFQNTGRGMIAKENIFAGSTIAKIPYRLLITVKTVLESKIGWIFSRHKFFTTQQVLSVFLVWERHLGEFSTWNKYINCLPKTFSCPAYCNNIDWLPSNLKEKTKDIQNNILKTYHAVVNIIDKKKCDHCNTFLSSIFAYEMYSWAWCIVSTRAVYLCPSTILQSYVLLSDENNLALAPYIDFFNHNCCAEVKAYIVESEGIYQIETLIPFSKNSEIFINYGPLSNDRLFIDYGFIIPSNIQDIVSFSYDNVLDAVNEIIPSNKYINEYRCRFLKEKKLFTDVSCHADGLSWDCQALIFVFSCPPDVKIEEIKRSIFSNKFKNHSWDIICRVVKVIINKKLNEYEKESSELMIKHGEITKMYGECFTFVRGLLGEHIKLLNKCALSLETEKK